MPPNEKLKLGEILIQQKLLTPVLVERILGIANSTHRRLGQTLEDLGLLTGEEIAKALAVQFGYKIVSGIAELVIPPETLRLVSMEAAFEHRVFPLQVRDNRLALAMADPTNTAFIGDLKATHNLTVVPFVATTQEIMKAIAKKYMNELLEPHANSILVVEPDYRDRQTIVAPLSKQGYTVVEGVDTTEGFQLALLHRPGLVVTAKQMPDGDGFSLFTTLQSVAETRRIPVILLSLRATPEEEAMAYQRGFFDYISAPVRDITLLSRVSRAVAAGKAYMPHRPSASATGFIDEVYVG